MSGVDTREKILEAADELFAQVGYDAATTRDIAERSGVNKALIHYHFKSKEALLESVLDRYYEKLGLALNDSLQGEGAVLERSKGLIDTYVDFLSENRNFARTVQREASGGKHLGRIREHMVPIFEMGMKVLQDEYPATRCGDMAADQLLTTFYGMVVTYFTYSDVLEYLIGRDPLGAEELEKRKKHLHRMIDIIEQALEEQEPGSRKKGGR